MPAALPTAALFAAILCVAAQPPAPKPAPAKPGIAVIELFTSEGCSSCPPADELLSKIAAEKQANVFCLAMPVDYWDYLGWKDRFASADFSSRQRTYATALAKAGNKTGVYTPQMIVNGTDAFVGSDSKLARAAIDKALAAAPPLTINPKIDPHKPDEPLHISAAITGESKGAELLFALVEDGLSSEVKAGENAGRTLHHDRVVRVFAHVPIKDAKAAADLKLPADAKPDHCRVVVFAQDTKTLHILGAAEIALSGDGKPASTPAK